MNFITVRLADPARTVALNLAIVAQVIAPEDYDNVCVELTTGESHCGTRAQMLPLLAAVGLAPAPPVAPTQDALDAALDAFETQVEDEEIGAIRELLREMRDDEERDLALAHEMIAEQLSNQELLDLDWAHGYVQPGKAPLVVLLSRRDEAQSRAAQNNAPRAAYCDRFAGGRDYYLRTQREMFEAARKMGLPLGDDAREPMIAAICAFLRITITSRTQLAPWEMERVTKAINAHRIFWSASAIAQAA